MNKSLGTSLGAVVFAAVLLRTTGSAPNPSPGSGTPKTPPAAAGKKSAGDGPWSASCDYWAPARPFVESEKEQSAFSLTLDPTQHSLTGILPDVPDKREPECGGDTQERWGLPAAPPQETEIRTLIAIVPDPVRTNMALQFDRTVDPCWRRRQSTNI